MDRATVLAEGRSRHELQRRLRLRGALIAVCVFGSLGTEPQQKPPAGDLAQVAAGFHEFFMHDECTGEFPPQPDTCLHKQLHEKSFTFGGKSGTVYDVTLRVRGIFEPTIIEGGETPYSEHPYFKVGGKVRTADWSHWHIDVSDPKQTR